MILLDLGYVMVLHKAFGFNRFATVRGGEVIFTALGIEVVLSPRRNG